jgi:hypothetical protein
MAEQAVTIRISAKNLTTAEFKKARSEVLGLGGDTEKAAKKTQGLGGSLKSFFSEHAAIFKAVAVGATAVVGAIGAVATAVVKLGQRGAAVADVKSQFDALSIAAGATGETMLGALSRGVVGTLSNFDLMKVANKSLGAGLLKTTADAETLAAGARVLAKRTGGETVQAFEMLTTAIASGRTASLKQMGLFVDLKVAIASYAAELGVTESQLTDADRATALANATMAALRNELDRTNPGVADFGELIERGKVAVKNITDALAVQISQSPPMLAGMHAIGDALGQAYGTESADQIVTIVNLIERGGIIVAEFAKATLTAAGVGHQAFSGLKAVVYTVVTGIITLADTVNRATASTLELASKVPGVGGAFEGAAVSARALADQSSSLKYNFQQLTNEAIEGAKGQGTFGQGIASARASVDAIQQSMVNAGLSTRALGTDAAGATPPVSGLGLAGDETAGALDRLGASAAGTLAPLKGIELQGPTTAEALKTIVTTAAGLSTQVPVLNSQLIGTSASFAGIGVAIPPVIGNMTHLAGEVSQTVIPSLGNLDGGIVSSLKGLFNFGKGFDTLAKKATDIFGSIFGGKGGGGEGVLGGMLGKFFGGGSGSAAGAGGLMGTIMSGGLAAVGNILLPGFGSIMSALGGIVGKGLSAIGGMFKKLLSGPSAKELGGREVARAFDETVNAMWDGVKDRVEPATEQWQRNNILLREAYIAMGHSADEAITLAGRKLEELWAAEKQGPEATQQVADQIREILDALNETSGKTADGFDATADSADKFVKNVVHSLKKIPKSIDIEIKGTLSLPKVPAGGASGFARGTTALDFERFGAGRMAALHGDEAVIPRGRGHELAREIAAALPSSSAGGDVYLLVDTRGEVERLSRQQFRHLERAMGDGTVRITRRAVGDRVR